MKILNGHEFSKELDKKILTTVTGAPSIGTLGIVQVGDNASSNKYISIKQSVGKILGIPTKLFKFPESLSDKGIQEKVESVLSEKDITSVIIQLPLPRKSLNLLLDLIPPEKDVDMLSSYSQNAYYASSSPYTNDSPHLGSICHVSPIIRSVQYVTNEMNLPKNAKVLIVGGGFLVGKPLEQLFKSMGLKVTVTDTYTCSMGTGKNLVVLGAGIPGLAKGENFDKGTNVIDFGSSVVSGKTKGDLDMLSDLDHLGTVVPSPRGMGPLVVRFLFLNHLRPTHSSSLTFYTNTTSFCVRS